MALAFGYLKRNRQNRKARQKLKANRIRKWANKEAELQLKKMDDDAGRPLTHRKLRGLSSPKMDGSPPRGVDKRSNLTLSHKRRRRK
jgi:hypothetical protein